MAYTFTSGTKPSNTTATTITFPPGSVGDGLKIWFIAFSTTSMVLDSASYDPAWLDRSTTTRDQVRRYALTAHKTREAGDVNMNIQMVTNPATPPGNLPVNHSTAWVCISAARNGGLGLGSGSWQFQNSTGETEGIFHEFRTHHFWGIWHDGNGVVSISNPSVPLIASLSLGTGICHGLSVFGEVEGPISNTWSYGITAGQVRDTNQWSFDEIPAPPSWVDPGPSSVRVHRYGRR